MKTLTNTIKTIFVTSLVLLFGIGVNVHALTFEEIPFEFEDYGVTDLGWVDSADDGYTGSTALGFSVTIGGAAYSYFQMGSNGDIELLTDAGDVPTGHGYDSLDGLINTDSNSTYLLAAYDDLSSSAYGYYGYKLPLDDPNRAVFYYETETFQDTGVPLAQLNLFEVILYEDGNVQWNFNYAEYSFFVLDLFSGLYFGNTQTLLELTRYYIPEQESYLYYGCTDWLTDFNNDCFTDLADVDIFTLQWLKCAELNDPSCQP